MNRYAFLLTIPGSRSGPEPSAANDTGSFTVEHADGHARVIWESSFAALDPAMSAQLAEMWEPYLPLVLSNLKKLVESQ